MAIAGQALTSFQDVEDRVERATARAVNAWARKVLRRAKVYAPLGPPVRNSQGQFAPRVPDEFGELHPGHLKASGALAKEASADEPYPFAEVAFSAIYAARQHEELYWKHPQGGGAKYLERAFKELLPELPRDVTTEIEIELGR